ncbi:MAG: hypothetical protein KDE47_24825, partial [Caldilineaceae bacterium]|nr:hypothetical protein [Caldilineaceae bacterium]
MSNKNVRVKERLRKARDVFIFMSAMIRGVCMPGKARKIYMIYQPGLFTFMCVNNAGPFGPNRRRSDNFYTSNLRAESPLRPAKLVGREQYLLSIRLMIHRMHNHQLLPDLA